MQGEISRQTKPQNALFQTNSLSFEQQSVFLSVPISFIHQLTPLLIHMGLTPSLANPSTRTGIEHIFDFAFIVSQIVMSLPTIPNDRRYPLKWLHDPAEAQRVFKRWMLKRHSKGRLYKDKSLLLPFPPSMYSSKPSAKELPTITVTTAKGNTLFLHENLEFRNLVRRSWRSMRR